jgi:ppGpp synthetase/RelA/SpoT-type nucleotidyltranferase
MPEKPTASQLNKLGERLRKGHANDDDIRALNDFRESFRPAFERVVGELESLGLAVGGRAAKTMGSIVAKLAREKTRLSTMQDIAGCRVEVANRIEQDSVVEQIVQLFPNSKIDNRRARPSHHYRAMHVIVEVDGFPVEVQIRTTLQNKWAQLAEALADRFLPEIKYGGGPPEVQEVLEVASNDINESEELEFRTAKLRARAANDPIREEITALERQIADHKKTLQDRLTQSIMSLVSKD